MELRILFEPSRTGAIADRLIIHTNTAEQAEIAVAGQGLNAAAITTEDEGITSTNVAAGGTCDNRQPLISAPSLLIARAEETLRFVVSATDPDGDPITLSAAHLPPGATFQAASGEFLFHPTANCGDAIDPVHSISFTARDDRGASSSVPVQITVVEPAGVAHSEPIISVPARPLAITPGGTVRFRVMAADGQDCAATVSMSGERGVFEPADGEYQFTASASASAGSMLVPFRASGCNGTSASRTVRIDVVAPGAESRPRLSLAVQRVAFGDVPVGSQTGYAVLPLSNDGDAPMTVQKISVPSGTPLRFDGILGLPVILQPGQQLPVRVALQPRVSGDIVQTVTINTSAGTATIAVSGRGVN
jgi:hypothetical protein